MASFNPTEEGLGFDLASLVKLQTSLTPAVEKFRTMRNEYRETCKTPEKVEVSKEAQEEADATAVGVIDLLRSMLLTNPESALAITDELKSITTDVTQVGKDWLMSEGREVEDGEGDEKKLQVLLDHAEYVSGMFKVFDGLKNFVLDSVSIEDAKKAGLKLKKNTKKNAKTEWVTENPNDPSGSIDELGVSKAGRPSNVQTFEYLYSINGKQLPKATPRFNALLQASEGASSIYTWQDLHHAIKQAGQEIGADTFEVKFSNGVVFAGKKVQK